MLAKSKKSACVMAGAASLSYAVTTLVFSLATHYATARSLPSIQEEFNNAPLSWLSFAIFVIILFIVIGVGGLIINAIFSSDIHFGISGLIRWSLFGMMEAVLVNIYSSIFAIQAFILRDLIELAIVVISYLIVFKTSHFSHQDKKASIS